MCKFCCESCQTSGHTTHNMDDICNAIRELGPKRKAEIESYMASLSLCEQSKMKSSGFLEIYDVSYAFYHGFHEFS